MKTFNNYYKEQCEKDPERNSRVETELETLRVQAKLYAARTKAGLTQQQVAERMNVNRSFISRLENQPGNITLGTLERYAHAVGLHCEILLHA